MKRKDLIDQLVSEIEKGKVRTLGITVMGLRVNQSLHRNCTKL